MSKIIHTVLFKISFIYGSHLQESVFLTRVQKNIFLPYPANIYLFKVNNRNIRKRCETRLKLTIKTPERELWTYISQFFLVFLLLTLNSKY